MRAIIQRVKSASVTVDGKIVSMIDQGLLVLVGVGQKDTEEDCEKIASRILRLKLWASEDGNSQWKRNVTDIKGKVLCVSQFTLFANTKKGAKPDFHSAAKGEAAKSLYDIVLEKVSKGMPNGKEDIGDGVFGAMMDVALVNDGPVTITLDTEKKE
ncbi:similar to Saccharomyces cerevisiae YDL219W DTD1 D-Tyr-tRNA(Tyr) deacylase [Geotrichum candidum]|uniref:D-aminoacyl-tRNA deacylase n=1 Tax=Geotrichum candidum TaxID=1173061 RepID=A0A0J9XG28_GEOCN|nr:similar to Saccharomyces cerevisiae YDL219W DTD1 D-Tyr-tRNA(Tyr) deacylase [Geotrichum candidum]